MFRKQWRALKEYANSKGILIMGDVPFYVGIDSLDVWKDRESFLLDTDARPIFIAGVPPDYFSPTGQRWGNPIYNWEMLEKTGFRFWIDRLHYSSTLYDIIRMDHFRAFDTYWKIPAASETAVEGEWMEAPGYALFDKLFEELPDIWIVAEDLGDLRPEVLELRDAYDLPGMNIAEFSLLAPDNTKNQVIYTGTHDNQTLCSWYGELTEEDRKLADDYMGFDESSTPQDRNRAFIRMAFESVADTCVIPVQDYLCLDEGARMNHPSTLGNNWTWRMTQGQISEELVSRIRRITEITGRLP